MVHTPARNDSLKVIQLSDTHLFADEDATLFGVKSNRKFRDLILHLQQDELHDTDLILLTGDLSQDESPQSYHKIVEILDPLNTPIYWIPGNHDNIQNLNEAFKKANNFFHSRRLSTLHWNFIFLNTKQEGTDSGFLAENELAALRDEVAKSESKPLILVMHHHPMKVNTPLIDQHILRNHHEFWEIISSTAVKLIICGHVHGDYTLKHNEITIQTSPASCFQFPKTIDELIIEEKMGCKVYQLNEGYFNTYTKWY